MKFLRPRLITFDVTGTLLKTNLVEHYEEIAMQYGLTIDSGKLTPSFKTNYKQLTIEHPIFGKHTGFGWKNWWRMIVYNVFRDQNCSIPNHTLDKIATSLIEHYGTNKCWHTYPGTIELLQYLVKCGFILGVISNFDERLYSILDSTNIRSYFSFVLTSYAFGFEKPNPQIFEEALRLSKTISGTTILPHEAIHIGDNVDYDYFGAKKARWNAILIKREHTEENREENIPEKDTVTNLRQLKNHFSTFLNT